MKKLINASNLHVGGGVQVASSFIYQCSLLGELCSDISVVCSNKVLDNLPDDFDIRWFCT